LAGYEDLNDPGRLAVDTTFRLISSQRIWDRGAALTSTLHWFETELLTKEKYLIGLILVLTCAEMHKEQAIASCPSQQECDSFRRLRDCRLDPGWEFGLKATVLKLVLIRSFIPIRA
jgi:hypothetical protein